MYDDAPSFSDADLDRALAAADVLRAGGDGAAMVSPQELAALSPDEAGRLVADLADAGRVDALVMVVTATPPHRYPIATLLRMAAGLPPDYERDMLVRAVALAPAVRLRSALDEVGADPALEDVLTQVAIVRAFVAAETPYRWWVEPEMAMAEPMGNGREPRAGGAAPSPRRPCSAALATPAPGSPIPASTSRAPVGRTSW